MKAPVDQRDSPAGPVPKVGCLKFGGDLVDVDYFLTKDYVEITEARDELPGIIEFLNGQLQWFGEQKILAKHELKKAESAAFFDLRNATTFFERGYAGKPTDKALALAVALDPGVDAAVKRFAEMAAWVTRITNLMMALQMKMDLVRSSEATSRRLMESEPYPEDRERQ